MLKFFRRIRHKLLAENRFSKYFLYAIGEIVLVVIGILIALQINNWNEERKNIAQKNAYCAQLITSLKSDRKVLKEFYNRLLAVEKKGKYLWEFVSGTEMEIDTNLFKNHFLSAANAFEFTPKTTAYDNMVASNGLNLIKNDSLKILLPIYFVPQKGELESAKQRSDYDASYNNTRFEFTSPMMLKKYLNAIFKASPGTMEAGLVEENQDAQMDLEVDLSQFEMDWEKLRKSKVYKVYLGRMLAIREPQLNSTKEKQLLIEKMINLLEKEINQR
ncbi:DUF6090 family protein [Croceivirga thetidis]|uniref:Uncharacterized protein n=1 Tax=Croceivirga thetidis TaxID=2721623 RepID=A0ABX1GLZ1_9FLAO|nr:DUF6090 family protein [Croceivirga thetidis]NKI30935.1 hypothetical protein [Croceivirga thetidis]